MGNLIDLPNITPESIIIGENGGSKKKSNFTLKDYLDIRPAKGETQKTTTFRLLPMDLETGNPFVKVHVHNVKVPKEMVKEGQKPYKDFICLRRNDNIDHEKYGNKCPFCEINNKAYKEAEACTDPVQKKDLYRISCDYKTKDAIICRGIERGKENEGVKFWKFKLRDDKADPYHQIIKLYQQRKAEAERAGQVLNILDIYNGRDLTITTTAESTSAPQILDVSISTPLSTDEEQMRKWIYDEKKWQDVFSCKDYDYLNLVAQMKNPWKDKETGAWISKEDYEAKYGKGSTDASEEVDNAKETVKEMAKAVEKQAEPVNEAPVAAPQPAPVKEAAKQSFAASITIDDEDLPF